MTRVRRLEKKCSMVSRPIESVPLLPMTPTGRKCEGWEEVGSVKTEKKVRTESTQGEESLGVSQEEEGWQHKMDLVLTYLFHIEDERFRLP